MNMREKIARTLHGKLFATIMDWRDEVCEWEALPDRNKREFCMLPTPFSPS